MADGYSRVPLLRSKDYAAPEPEAARQSLNEVKAAVQASELGVLVQAEGQLTPAEAGQSLSIMAACRIVGVSRRTIYNWIERGKVPYQRTAGGAIRIRRGDLLTPVIRRTQP